MQLNYEVDSAWCLEQLCLDGFLSERDQALVKTTQRKPQQMDWHPLRWIANFQLKEQRTKSCSIYPYSVNGLHEKPNCRCIGLIRSKLMSRL